jgi:hypothetical protein
MTVDDEAERQRHYATGFDSLRLIKAKGKKAHGKGRKLRTAMQRLDALHGCDAVCAAL